MGKFDWYPRNPSKFFAGTIGLPFEVKTAYGLVLDLIWDSDDRLADDPRWIAGMMGCSVRKWHALEAELIRLGKLKKEGGFIKNGPASRMMRRRLGNGLLPAERSEKQRQHEGNPNYTDEIISGKSPDNSNENEITGPENNGLATGASRARARVAGARENLEIRNKNQNSGQSEKTETKIARLCTLLGIRLEADLKRINWPRQLIELEAAGLDFERHILPTVKAYQGPADRIASLKFFEKGALQRKEAEDLAQRINAQADDAQAVKVAEITAEDWLTALVKLAHRGLWNEDKLGPPPSRPGSRVPPALAADFLDGWAKQGSHPVEELDANAYFVRFPAKKPSESARKVWAGITKQAATAPGKR